MPAKARTYTVKEAAKKLGYSTNSVYNYLRSGVIKSIRLGKGKFKIPAEALEKFIPDEPANKVDDFKDIPKKEIKPEVLVSSTFSMPRPGKSLADMSGESLLHTLRLWFEERVGLPRLFDWFISLSSIILGISMYLHTKQVDLLVVGRFDMWFEPIKIALITGGFGLILADMIQEEYLKKFKNPSNFFRFILIATYSSLAMILLQGNDIDGFLIHGLFALAILVEALTDVRSSTAYMLYIQGLLLGTALIFYIFPTDAGLSTITTILFTMLGGFRWVWIMVVSSFVLVTLFGFFWDKKVLKVSASICGGLLVLLAIVYANNNYWSRAFFLLISGMVGVILPFWDKFKEKIYNDRPLVFRMFGTVLMAFSLVVLLIGIVQSILMNDANTNLAEKANYGKIVSERTVENVSSTLEGVAGNPTFITAVKRGDAVTVDGFAKSIFKNNIDLGEVITIGKDGNPISSYPYSVEIMNSFYGYELFYKNSLIGHLYFSRTIEEVPGLSKNSIVIAVPITDPVTKGVIGSLVAPISVTSLGDRLSEIASGDQKVVLVDGDGRWIVNDDPKLLGEIIPESDTTGLLWTKEVAAEIGYDGTGKYSLFRSEKSKDIGWSVVVTQPVFSILDVSRSGLVLVLILLSITTLVVSFSFVFAKNKD